MTAVEVAAVVGAITGVLSVVLLIVWLVPVTRSLTALQHDVAELRRDREREPVRVVERSPERVAAVVLDGDDVDLRDRPAPRLAAVAFSDPVIKAVAFASGASKAVRSFRKPA